MPHRALSLRFAVVLWALWIGSAVALAADPPVVILLSWDGTRHDYPERVATVALARMAREGARAARLTPVFPSSTFPNHVALATGTYVDRHGIIGNRFTDRAGRRFDYSNESSWLEAEPLWVAAERQGVRAATYFWVGSETDWRGRGASLRVVPFDADVGEKAKVDQILAWLDRPPAERPRLIMAWWHGCDHVGHEEGPDSPNIAAALREQDAELARLLAGLDARAAWPYTTLIVASDHGMTTVKELVPVPEALEAAGIEARFELAAGEAQIYLAKPAQRDAALAALARVEGVTAYACEALPPKLRSCFPGRSGDITVIAEPPRVIARPGTRQKAMALLGRIAGRSSGAHGYDPDHPDMGAIFFALGRGVPRGAKLDTVRAIDVAPTAAVLLGIDPPAQSEGTPLFHPPPE